MANIRIKDLPAVTEPASEDVILIDGATTRKITIDDFLIAVGSQPGPGYGGSSATSLAIGTGARVFATQAGLAYTDGARVRASSAADPTKWMEGLATYAGSTLTMTSDKTNGAGTFADWNFNIVGQPGAGDMTSSNNLSDVSSKRAAIDNLSVHGADIASATTINLETATGDLVDVTGTTTITAITLSEGHERTVRFTGALTLTHGASLLLPGAVSIPTVAGDFAVFRGYAAGVVRCVDYTKVSGKPVTASTPTEVGAAALAGNQNLTGGFTASSDNDGTVSSGTYTPDPLTGNFKYITANGAFTLAPPAAECSIVLEVLNGASAGAITTSGFTKVDGAFTTTNGHKFLCAIVKTKNYSYLSITALQ